MNNIGDEMQTATIAREYDESFNYDLTTREVVTLAIMLAIIIGGLILVALGVFRLRSMTARTDSIETETAKLVEASAAQCRSIRNQAILMKVYKMGAEHDLPIVGPTVTRN